MNSSRFFLNAIRGGSTWLSAVKTKFREQKISITVSAGWADYEPSNSPQRLLVRADEALYANKQSRGGDMDGIGPEDEKT